MRVTRSVFAIAALCIAGTAGAALEPDELMPGKVTVIKPLKLAKFVAKGTFALPAPENDPTVSGGTLQIFDTVGGAGNITATLNAAGWKRLPGNAAKPLKGYKYKGTGDAGDPCKAIIVKAAVVKGVCKGGDVALTPPFIGNAGIVLSLAGDMKRYCAEFGGTDVKNDAKQLKRKDADPPSVCPTPGSGTTTSTTVGGSSTTSTTLGGACCNGDSFLSFATINAPGDCGDIRNQSGALFANVACAGLFTGGGGNSVPLPLGVPDLGFAVTAITSCTGPTANVGPTTSTQTTSNRTCTSPGCLFGGPLAVPNTGTPPTSVCVLNSVSAGPAGTVDCSTGATDISLPLSSILYLTGDTATDPMATIPGVQPCPLCSGGSCIGGPNNGMSCTASTTSLGGNPAYPTSHDCPPDETFNIGTLPVAFALSSGTLSWTATTGLGGSTQLRVFSGFCRDADDTGAFESPANKCLENGVPVGGGCSGIFEACEQRNQGAFGPSGGGNKTITAIGSAASILGGPAAATLVSIFSVPPTFNATVDAAGDLPGPGAVAIPGTAQSCAAANPCP